MDDVLFLSAPLKEKLWGGTYFKDVLHKTTSNQPIGEMWSASGHPEGPSIVENGSYKGQKLDYVYKNHPELFGNSESANFPLLIKIIAAQDKLSVQVHPDDAYAEKVEHQSGKNEGWLILAAAPEAGIIVGQKAKDRAELTKAIEKENYDSILNFQPVNPGEFYPIPAGTIHAIGGGVTLLEIQQSSDVTYRFYDYHRKDQNGKERPLHIKRALDVVSYRPYVWNGLNAFTQKDEKITLWNNRYFVTSLYNVKNKILLNSQNKYLVLTSLSNDLYINNQSLPFGASCIITALANDVEVKGNGRLVVTKSYH